MRFWLIPFALLVAVCNLTAQGSKAHFLTVQLQPHFEGHLLNLAEGKYIQKESKLTIETLRFYLSNFSLFLEGQEVWREEMGYHLLDAAKPETFSIALEIPSGLNYDAIAFQLGTDSLANVSGAMEGDLDPTKGMYWAWNSGYINFKLEGNHPDCPTRNQAFQFHLGGYMPPHQTVQSISLPATPKADINIQLDIAAFLNHLDLSKEHTIMSPGAAGSSLATFSASLFRTDVEE